MSSLSMEFGVFGGLIIPAFSIILSLNSPVYRVEMLTRIVLSCQVVVISEIY